MNTDNMTISGETIDYGPCAFMDAFDPATVFSSIDHAGRYAYRNQPLVAEWNLARLAEALLPLLHDDEEQAVSIAEEALGRFRPLVQRRVVKRHAGQARPACRRPRRGDLGSGRGPGPNAAGEPRRLHVVLPPSRCCRTRRHRARAGLFLDLARIDGWMQRWRALGPDPEVMDRTNPAYIPRNHLVEEALTAATAGDLRPFEQLLEAVTSPYDERPGFERYAVPAPEDFGRYQTFCGT